MEWGKRILRLNEKKKEKIREKKGRKKIRVVRMVWN